MNKSVRWPSWLRRQVKVNLNYIPGGFIPRGFESHSHYEFFFFFGEEYRRDCFHMRQLCTLKQDHKDQETLRSEQSSRVDYTATALNTPLRLLRWYERDKFHGTEDRYRVRVIRANTFIIQIRLGFFIRLYSIKYSYPKNNFDLLLLFDQWSSYASLRETTCT